MTERSWSNADLRDMHGDLLRLRSYDLANQRLSELLRGAADMIVAADVEISGSGNECPKCGWAVSQGENGEKCRACLGNGFIQGSTQHVSIDGNEIWEALFRITKGFVPEGMTEEVCGQLATALSASFKRADEPV